MPLFRDPYLRGFFTALLGVGILVLLGALLVFLSV
jgi:hypothetical protein